MRFLSEDGKRMNFMLSLFESFPSSSFFHCMWYIHVHERASNIDSAVHMLGDNMGLYKSLLDSTRGNEITCCGKYGQKTVIVLW